MWLIQIISNWMCSLLCNNNSSLHNEEDFPLRYMFRYGPTLVVAYGSFVIIIISLAPAGYLMMFFGLFVYGNFDRDKNIAVNMKIWSILLGVGLFCSRVEEQKEICKFTLYYIKDRIETVLSVDEDELNVKHSLTHSIFLILILVDLNHTHSLFSTATH